MACTLLSEIHKDSHQWTVCVLVSRMWHFRDGTDEGPIKHTDLVLLDKEGNHMYGQIPPNSVDRLKDVLKEGQVYVIKKFLCNPSRPSFRTVESPFMIQFTKYTIVEPKPGLEDTFPFCTYSLTAFADIPKPSITPARFIDVIGKITMVSDVIPVQSMHQTKASNTRTIMLMDLNGEELRLVLWGDRAIEFDGDAVRAMGVKEPVIAIFVGTLPKVARGIRGLSGSAACRWYIDEDIADINSFRASLGELFVPLAAYVPTGADAMMPRIQEAPVAKTVNELIELDPFVDMDKRFFCTVTVTRLGNDQRWWFPSCSTCRKSAKHTGYQYQCSGDGCLSVDADLTYCISVFASDGTTEAEFVLFDKVAAAAVGKPLVSLLRQLYPGYATMEEIASVARHDSTVPPQIARLIGQKHTLMVSISKKWKVRNTEDLSFQVARIEETYKPELPPLVPAVSSSLGGSLSINTASGEQVQPLLPVIPPIPATPSPRPSNTNQPFSASSGSPAVPAHTPSPPIAKLSPSTPAARPTAPMRGARRSLFQTPAKEKTLSTITDGSSSDQGTVSAVLDDIAIHSEDGNVELTSITNTNARDLPLKNKAPELLSPSAKDDKVLPSKNNDPDAEALPNKSKRNSTLAKSEKASKKPK